MNAFFTFLNPEVGLCALIFALCFWTAQVFSAFLAYFFPRKPIFSTCAKSASLTGFVAIFIAISSLLFAFAMNDFSVALVTENSASNAPLLYRLAGSWGNHNGSLLLWLFLLAICNYVAAIRLSHLKEWHFKSLTQGFLGLITASLSAFCLFTSNPFLRIFPAPEEGAGLNPLLLDPGLACHPPLLYAGYVCFAVPFSLTLSALLLGKCRQKLFSLLRNWVVIGWCLLSGGIILGAWWAYGTLGWGGYWFWDPVENASLMPWLTATALLHTSALAEKKRRLISWCFALSLSTFILSLMATFFVRSGIMNSVHSFAAAPEKGEAILLLITIAFLSGFGLFALRASLFREKAENPPIISTENAVAINNIILYSMMVTVFIGTLYPPLSQFLAGHILSVGKPFFNQTILPMALLLLLIMGVAFFLPWKGKVNFRELFRKSLIPAILSLFFSPALFYLQMPLIADFFYIGAVWMICASAESLYSCFRNKQKYFYPMLAHIGIGISILGLCGISASQGDVVMLSQGQTIPLNHETWQLDFIKPISKSDYKGIKAHFSVFQKGKLKTVIEPEKRFYIRQRQALSPPAVKYGLLEDHYAVLSAISTKNGDEKFLFKLRIHPLGSWFWIGGIWTILMVFLAHTRINFLSFKKKTLS
ncbi:heme lyase CcmF/NrfE family subunit [Acetobacteraceae bacterium]|nr:heme lyase CcmF/NrfE family subunit [Acetobacteraceae bacterium]